MKYSSNIADIVCTSIKLTGVPACLSIEDIKHYFEATASISGFRKGSVRNCILKENGVAIVEFHQPAGNMQHLTVIFDATVNVIHAHYLCAV